MSAGTVLAVIAIAAILGLPTLAGWLTKRRQQRGHDWSCECRERRQDALSRHPAGQGMDEVSRVMWAELDAFEAAADWDRRSAEAESFSADEDQA